jgi:hypothetical protein
VLRSVLVVFHAVLVLDEVGDLCQLPAAYSCVRIALRLVGGRRLASDSVCNRVALRFQLYFNRIGRKAFTEGEHG